MLENFVMVLREAGVLFVLMLVGFVCQKTKCLTDQSLKGIVNLLIWVVNPALIITVFQRPYDNSMSQALGEALLCAVGIHVVLIALAYLIFRRACAASRPVLQLAFVFSNSGFMGFPLERALLGDAGVFYGAIYVAVFNLFIWSWGYITAQGNGGGLKIWTMIKSSFLNPGTLALALAWPLFIFSLELPQAVGRPLASLADLNTPLAMITIGYFLASSPLSRILRMPAAWGAALWRLVLTPILFGIFFYVFQSHFDRVMMLALLTAAATPVATMVPMFAAKYKQDIALAVGLVSLTTLLSVLTMPLLIAWAKVALTT